MNICRRALTGKYLYQNYSLEFPLFKFLLDLGSLTSVPESVFPVLTAN